MVLLQNCMRLRTAAVIPLIIGLMAKFAIGTQEDVGLTEITPKVLVFATVAGNVVDAGQTEHQLVAFLGTNLC